MWWRGRNDHIKLHMHQKRRSEIRLSALICEPYPSHAYGTSTSIYARYLSSRASNSGGLHPRHHGACLYCFIIFISLHSPFHTPMAWWQRSKIYCSQEKWLSDDAIRFYCEPYGKVLYETNRYKSAHLISLRASIGEDKMPRHHWNERLLLYAPTQNNKSYSLVKSFDDLK